METQTSDVGITNQTGEASESVTPNGDIAESPRTVTPEIEAAPTPPPPMTLREFKKLRAKYFTVKHQRMEPCGHRLDAMNEPRNNCEYCWFAFFQTHGELVQTTDRAIQEQGTDFVDKMRGIKYRKMFLRFMSTMAMFQKEIERAKENEQAGQDQSGSGVGEGTGQAVRIEGDNNVDGQESGPVAASLPNFAPVV